MELVIDNGDVHIDIEKFVGLGFFRSFRIPADSGVPRGGWVVQPPTTTPTPKFRSFDEVEPDCKLSGKCLVFLFQHPKQFKNC